MGSDLSMAANAFRPRATLARKNRAGRWVIHPDRFMSGYANPLPETHKDTPEVRRLMRALGIQMVKDIPTGGGW